MDASKLKNKAENETVQYNASSWLKFRSNLSPDSGASVGTQKQLDAFVLMIIYLSAFLGMIAMPMNKIQHVLCTLFY